MANLLLRGLPIGSIDGVLFDKDGTLSNSEPHLLDLAEQRLSLARKLWLDSGANPSQLDQLIPTLRLAFGLENGALHPGGTLAVASRQDNLISMATVFCLYGCSWPDGLALAHQCFDQADQSTMEPSCISPLLVGAGPLLSSLHSNGVRCAVISNDTRRGIDGFLSQHHLSALITERWSADDEPRKPDPQAVEELCARLGIAPQRCALIGDAETDLQMAAAAGVPLLIGFTGGWARRPELPSATHHLDDWNDLGMAPGP